MIIQPAGAAFDYVPPVEPLTFALADDDLSLSAALRRLVPPDLDLRFDRRVDTARSVAPGHGSLDGLLRDEGLAALHEGHRIVIHPEGVPADEVEISGPHRESGLWHVRKGEMLSDVLEHWGSRAGVDIVWLTDRRWRLDEGRTFDGRFAEAVRALLFALSHLPHAPVGELSGDGRSLAVLHRLPGAGE